MYTIKQRNQPILPILYNTFSAFDIWRMLYDIDYFGVKFWYDYSCGPLHMDEQRQDDQLEHIYKSSVPIQNVAMKTYREWRAIETGGGRGSGRSVLAARHDDDDYQPRLVYPTIRHYSVWNIQQKTLQTTLLGLIINLISKLQKSFIFTFELHFYLSEDEISIICRKCCSFSFIFSTKINKQNYANFGN